MVWPPFEKILVANRGEIAVRIIHACREMGIRTVAVYSDVDRRSLHVQHADQAVCIGGAPAAESYLNMERIIEAAQETGAQAIHPGYGFLAENHEFSRMCEKSKLIFIGPNSKAMELVGDKVRSRQTMEKAGVPIIPGMKAVCGDLAEIEKEAGELGYPVMIKASAGGGGKGMRIIRRKAELQAGIEAGRREAMGAFGDESVYLEKCIEDPRHVEFQVLADNYGNVIHLFERECSIQRRHQKIIEESPSPALDPDLRAKMGEAAVRVIQVSGYNNAGTVEFLLDEDKNFYFLEVNARLQVEHPVTELVTGIDLVQQQIAIASGAKLSLTQDMTKQKGHAIECRIYAEDPRNNFLPSSGEILYIKEPHGPGIRNDSGIFSGCGVPIFYDPILAKLIVWAEDRDKACRKMRCALDEYVILGVNTPIDFLKEVISHPRFLDGETTTGFIPRYFEGWTSDRESEDLEKIAAVSAAFDELSGNKSQGKLDKAPFRISSPWHTLGKWRIGGGNSGGL